MISIAKYSLIQTMKSYLKYSEINYPLKNKDLRFLLRLCNGIDKKDLKMSNLLANCKWDYCIGIQSNLN